ncbi:deoxyribodipyrimidine photo-lyase [bacterium]|nr:deoxyribodipyrimidine photo-lyase [bacterium]
MSKNRNALVWFRRDLRVDDNPALSHAIANSETIIPIFIWDKQSSTDWALGAAAKWWLHHALDRLDSELKSLDSKLNYLIGRPQEIIQALIGQHKIDAVYWNRRYEPDQIEDDAKLKETLLKTGLRVESFNASLLFEPWEIQNTSGKPYQVYTPFSKNCLSRLNQVEVRHSATKFTTRVVSAVKLTELELLPKIDWDKRFYAVWPVKAPNNPKNLVREFLADKIKTYQTTRNRPDLVGTSRLSPYLQSGQISPREIVLMIRELFGADINRYPESIITYLKEIIWREFGYHLLFHFPETINTPLKKEFLNFPWELNPQHLVAWQNGLTGYPLVDAGMRELWHTGWMHNRVRMIVGSFLVKDLRIHWLEGAKWFWDTLVDADLASNTLGWQWVSGSGADAAPYYRIFNPVIQGEKFDPQGDYVRQWIPEIAKLPNKFIHQPWNASAEMLTQAEVYLGQNYPFPVVDHAEERDNALEAYQELKARK